MFARIKRKAEQARTEDTRQAEEKGIIIEDTPLRPACSPPLTFREKQVEMRVHALASLEKLLELVTEQDKKYGYRLSSRTNFFKRHLMVKQFLAVQKKRLSGQTRRHLAISVAASFDRGHTTAHNIVQWENSWVITSEIPARKEVEMYASWLTDEDVIMAICEFA